MSDNASQPYESADPQEGRERTAPPGAAVRVRGRVTRDRPAGGRAGTPTAGPQRPRASRADAELAAYYRLRCIVLEAAVDRLGDELERERRRFDEVVARYESILQERGAEGTVADSRR
jgi:hypothetical protein